MEEDPVVGCYCSFLFCPLTSQATCSTDEKTGKDRFGAGGVGGRNRVRNDGLCEQTKILPAAKGGKNSFLFKNTLICHLI